MEINDNFDTVGLFFSISKIRLASFLYHYVQRASKNLSFIYLRRYALSLFESGRETLSKDLNILHYYWQFHKWQNLYELLLNN